MHPEYIFSHVRPCTHPHRYSTPCVRIELQNPLINHLYKHITLFYTPLYLAPYHLQQVVQYGSHASEHCDTYFFQGELADQTSCGNMVFLLLYLVYQLPNFCLSPVGIITQEVWNPELIYEYTFSGSNDVVL